MESIRDFYCFATTHNCINFSPFYYFLSKQINGFSIIGGYFRGCQLIPHLFLAHKARITVAFPRSVVTKIRAKVAISILAKFSSRSISGLFACNSVGDDTDVRFMSVSRLVNIRSDQL